MKILYVIKWSYCTATIQVLVNDLLLRFLTSKILCADSLFESQRAGGFPKITRLLAHQNTTNEYVSGDWDYVEYEAKLCEGLLQESHGILSGRHNEDCCQGWKMFFEV